MDVVIASATRVEEQEDILGRFFAEFLDENSFTDFRRAERLIRSLKRQGQTVSGYPIIRPIDCGKIVQTFLGIFESAKSHFRTRDPVITQRFEELISNFSEFCQKVYPSEAIGALILHADICLFMGDAERALALVEFYALRPYAVDGGIEKCVRLVEIFAQAHLQRGTLPEQHISFIAFGGWIASVGHVAPKLSPEDRKKKPFSRGPVRMAPFAKFGFPHPHEGRLVRIIRWASGGYHDATREYSAKGQRAWSKVRRAFYFTTLAAGYRLLSKSRRGGDPFSFDRVRKGKALVTRAMGGIGDLLMMAPGLEALASFQKSPVDFAIPKKFHAIFQHSPYVNLIDIDGPPIDISQYGSWVNLSHCPAGRYESSHRPNVRKGRVELFARAMRVKQKQLIRQGWRINHHISQDEDAFCDAFLAERGLGKRKLIGVQPFSRDSYKDHARIVEIIQALAEHHDVVIFHHLHEGLPKGPGIHSTAGVPLGKSIALVSRIDAMVAVDSAFLHAAAAFDVPVVALFGPTDARTFTRHHKRVKILWKPELFKCVPCWRNEDLPCLISGVTTMSPCVASITERDVLDALDEMLTEPAT